MKTFIFTLLILGGLCFGCNTISEKVNEAKQSVDVLEDLNKAAKNMEKSQASAEAKIAERRQRGDTVAMHYDKLKGYMPTDLQGYTPEGEGEGAIHKQMGMSFSSYKQKYKKDNQTMVVTLFDYNGLQGLYSAALGFLSGMEIENNQEMMKGLQFSESVKGMEKLEKQNKNASITVGTAERFILIVNADNQSSTDMVKTVAKSAKWSELAVM